MKRVIKQAKGEITLQEAFDLFIQEKEANGLSASTLRNYNLSWKIFSEYCEITLPSEINDGVIIKWINHMRKSEIAPSSMNHYLRDMRCFIN